jgi:hypothetical protein
MKILVIEWKRNLLRLGVTMLYRALQFVWKKYPAARCLFLACDFQDPNCDIYEASLHQQ